MTPRGLVAAALVTAALCGPSAAGAAPAGERPLAPPPVYGAATPPDGWPSPPEVTAAAYVVADLDTGQVIAAADADVRRPVASTVKVLTALSVLRRAALDEQITAGPEVTITRADAAGVGLDPGESWTVEDLLEGLVARSGNDAAAALAVGVGGSVAGFVELMRADAASLGLGQAVLEGPDGLDDRNRLSANDLLTITRAAMGDPSFAAIAVRPTVTLPGVGTVASRNALLGRYPGAVGVKTGYTVAAGRCVIAAAVRDDRRLVAVVLGAADPTAHFDDARRLLDFAFATFVRVPVSRDHAEVELRVPGGWVAVDAPPVALLAPVAAPDLDLRARLPVEVGTSAAGSLQVGWRGGEVGTVPLAGEGLDRPGSDGGAAVGEWLAERAYAAMRAATNASAWTHGDTAAP